MSSAPERVETSNILDALEAWIARNGDAGTDPYDALNSPLAAAAGLFGRWGRIAMLQALRRSPVNLRPLLLIRPGVNPKGMGLLAQAYLVLHRTRGEPRFLDEARRRMEWLEKHAVPCGEGIGWGYHFDWAARAFFVPRGTPTVVNTATVANAFFEAHRATGEAGYLDVAVRAARFVLTGLGRTETEAGLCFSYTPVDRSQVFNASLLGTLLLVKAAAASGNDKEFLEPAGRAVGFVLAHQLSDGSWPYGLAPFHRWTDSFHTGFVLRALGAIRTLQPRDGLTETLRRGCRFYAERLVAAEGRPLFRLDRPWPTDIHACAEAILAFSDPNLGEFFDAPLDRARRVAVWTVENLRRPDGAFGYQRFPRRTDRTAYLRWGQAWMLLALARLEDGLRSAARAATEPGAHCG